MISRADLHIHTTFSDGTLAPEDVLNYYAVHPEIAVIAITDHDTLDGALRVRRPDRLQDSPVGEDGDLHRTSLEHVPLDGTAVGQRAERLAATTHPLSPDRETPSMMKRWAAT